MTTPDNGSADEIANAPKPLGRTLRSRRGLFGAIGLAAGGAVVGGILATTGGASAAGAGSSPAPSAASSSAPGVHGTFTAPLTGTVTAVGTDSVDIKTSTGTQTYSVTTTSRISINELGAGALTGVKVGDTVRFTTTTTGGTVIATLRDGQPTAGGFGGGAGGPGGRGGQGFGGNGKGGPGSAFSGVRPDSGTVTAVGTGTVDIKTSTATTTYSVTTTTKIIKLGSGKPTPGTTPTTETLADIKVGDSVFFSTTTQGGSVLASLVDGKLPTVAGGFGGGRGGFGGHFGGPQAPGGSAAPTPAASPADESNT